MVTALGVAELQGHRERVTACLAERCRENLDDPECQRDLRDLAENIGVIVGGSVSS
jgi:hypothetical protein